MIKIGKIVFSFILVITLLTFLSAMTNSSVCCEKTTSGAWCQNAEPSECDSSYKIAPTSCDSTSYCKPGCCFETQEGLCMESTPQRVCEANNGSYAASSECQIAQCQLGCCLLGNQGAFVTLTRCKAMSGFFGLTTDFRKTITNELTCIATAQGADMGACVSDNGVGGKTCKFTSRSSCKTASLSSELNIGVNTSSGNLTSISNTENGTAPAGFYKDTLCSAAELGTDCGRSTKTMLLDGRDEVYYQDTCGNPANIYDASKYDDKTYWKKVYKKSESCGAGSNNANSKTCGNCDYYLGSIGNKSNNVLGKPTYGNYICIDLSCKNAGKKHGESWCVSDSPTGEGLDTVGSRYYKEVCLFGEVITEPCADYRNEICIEGKTGSFSEAACRVNRWQDCLSQVQESDCANTDARDCMWVSGYYYSTTDSQVEKSTNDTNLDGNTEDPTPTGLCLPFNPPGFKFWGNSQTTATPTSNFSAATTGFGTGYVSTSSGTSSAASMCSTGNSKLTVKWEKTTHPAMLKFLQPLLGGEDSSWQCVENCQYASGENLTDAEMKSWASEMNEICYKLGDCGGYNNWIGAYTDNGYAAYYNNKRVAGSGGAEVLETNKKTTATATNTGNTNTNTQTNSNTAGNTASTATNTLSTLNSTFGAT